VFSQVLDEMISISHLGGMRQRSVHRVGIGAGPISADHVNFSMAFEPGKNSVSGAIGQEIDWPARLEIDQNGSIAVPTSHGAGKGNDVAIIPSPKNRTGKFLYIRLKPFIAPVSPDAVSQRVAPGYELADGRWDEARPGFLPHLILLLIARAHDGCAIR
jgi:hypothetical protein